MDTKEAIGSLGNLLIRTNPNSQNPKRIVLKIFDYTLSVTRPSGLQKPYDEERNAFRKRSKETFVKDLTKKTRIEINRKLWRGRC
ncbi:unnamed protein product [Arabidopsis lyrata]|uniref:Predicted protein n=1 Tax=Arabidopsis lyrata subsp. lyrata TaxID=81972 RepID=D7LR18_ARALL|nr:predicted protein [Arabidopsis lyrata subsp. lyrata]CAH8266774.1 unnamed protein product [Arabidopsis lyrata]